MGCRTSAHIFETFSTALEWVIKNKFNLKHVHHVLDDFLLVTKPPQLAERQLNIFLAVCNYLGIPVVIEKIESGTIITFLGVELNTVLLEARLPKDKIKKCTQQIQAILGKTSVTQLELNSLAGLLNFACSVVRPGRPFMKGMYDAAASVKGRFHRIKVRGGGALKQTLTCGWHF